MKILNISAYTQHLQEMAATDKTVTVIHDFFAALEKLKKGTIVYVYYANDFTPYLPKFIKHEDGTKEPNPMLNRLYKLSTYRFQAGKEYYAQLEKLFPGYMYDPNSPVNQEKQPNRPWEPLPPGGKPCQKNKKNGEIALPVVDSKTTWTQYVMVDETGNYVPVDYETVQPYMKPPKPSTGIPVTYKMLYVNKIYMLNGGGQSCPNTYTFLYPFLKPFFKKQAPQEQY